MKTIWAVIGRALYVPVSLVVGRLLRGSERTRLLVVNDNKILLIQNWLGDGHWSLPGGGLHRGEPAVSGALRELREETGLTIAADQLEDVGRFIFKQHNFYFKYQLFMVRLEEQVAVLPQWPEVLNVQWVDRSDLAAFRLGAEVLTAVDQWPH